MMAELSQTVRKTIGKYNMCTKSECLLVCLSGGADSTALLLCLYELGYKVKACHVNHCLRGAESDRDEAFCRELCKRLSVPFESARIDVNAYCKEHGVSTELGARELRYRYFDSIEADRICTAHTLSDNLETALFNLSRGTGLKGLSGIPAVRGRIIRPLINSTREEVEAYLAEHGQDFVTDSTNLEDIYSRNKIRHRIIPVMRELNEGLFTSYRDTADNLRADSEYLDKLAADLFSQSRQSGGYDTKLLSQAHISIRRRALMQVISAEGFKVSAQAVRELDQIITNGGRYNITKGISANVSKGLLSFDPLGSENDEKKSIPVKGNGEIEYCGRVICFEITAAPEKIENIHEKFTNCCLDYDKIRGELVVRARASGDKIRLCSREFTSDVRKLINSAFRQNERNRAVLLADSEGVVFVEGFGSAERVKIDSSTKRILVFRIS
ncbi:MAG: tRNA lysidine(34) synthetase TilS [Ruminococcus sp.]|nr:tRNA lysidine(34) synthetase TilS [Ruminococcus sp.]